MVIYARSEDSKLWEVDEKEEERKANRIMANYILSPQAEGHNVKHWPQVGQDNLFASTAKSKTGIRSTSRGKAMN